MFVSSTGEEASQERRLERCKTCELIVYSSEWIGMIHVYCSNIKHINKNYLANLD